MVLSACSDTTAEGTAVSLTYVAPVPDALAFNAEAGTVTVTGAWLALESFALEEQEGALASAARLLRPIAVANAHGDASPLSTGTPYLFDLLTGTTPLGTLAPPVAAYERLVLDFAPADADAENLASTPDLQDATLLLRGTVTDANGQQTPFTAIGTASATVALAVDLAIHKDTPHADLQLSLELRDWLAAARLSALTDPMQDPSAVANLALSTLGDHLSVVVR